MEETEKKIDNLGPGGAQSVFSKIVTFFKNLFESIVEHMKSFKK